ncbi:MAG: hypothetical protein Q8K57_13390 [Thiobacillus sp.]|nr:hypothetical protein [Thiobacillus sp.]MDP1925762.1 hypothetical protein [Thiobacillus sp.]
MTLAGGLVDRRVMQIFNLEIAMKYRKKPVVIDAIQWTGGNRQDVADFCGDDVLTPIEAYKPFQVGTLEGQHTASLGDWIIRGVQGEHYPCKPDIFEATYEAA